jgi:hypothetical protein
MLSFLLFYFLLSFILPHPVLLLYIFPFCFPLLYLPLNYVTAGFAIHIISLSITSKMITRFLLLTGVLSFLHFRLLFFLSSHNPKKVQQFSNILWYNLIDCISMPFIPALKMVAQQAV